MSFHLFTGTETYLVTPELRDAVNVACALEKPLLIRGEPGTGKTVLAEAIAENLNKPLLTWNIKSTTKAQDGLYVYDTVQRLNDCAVRRPGYSTTFASTSSSARSALALRRRNASCC